MTDLFDAHTLFMTHAQLDRWLRTHISKALEGSELTMMEWLLLMTIRKHEKDGLTITEVADLLGVSLPQVTALTQQLHKKNLLKQQIEARDRRRRRLCITRRGSTVSKDAAKQLEDVIDDINEAPNLSGYRQLLARLAQQPVLQ